MITLEQIEALIGLMDRKISTYRGPGDDGYNRPWTATAVPALGDLIRAMITVQDPTYAEALLWCSAREIPLGIDGIRKLRLALKAARKSITGGAE